MSNVVAIADPKNPNSTLKPATASCAEITPHATNAVTATSGIMVNVGGNVAVRFEHDSADVTLTLVAGVVYPFRIIACRVSGTTATGIFGFY
jgi:hypothetical protein